MRTPVKSRVRARRTNSTSTNKRFSRNRDPGHGVVGCRVLAHLHRYRDGLGQQMGFRRRSAGQGRIGRSFGVVIVALALLACRECHQLLYVSYPRMTSDRLTQKFDSPITAAAAAAVSQPAPRPEQISKLSNACTSFHRPSPGLDSHFDHQSYIKSSMYEQSTKAK